LEVELDLAISCSARGERFGPAGGEPRVVEIAERAHPLDSAFGLVRSEAGSLEHGVQRGGRVIAVAQCPQRPFDRVVDWIRRRR
jgi:hypothetical protein